MINSQRQAARPSHNPKRYYSSQHSRAKQSPSPLSGSVSRSQVLIPEYCKFQNQPRQGIQRKTSLGGTKQTSVQTSMTNLSEDISKKNLSQNNSAYDIYIKDHKTKSPLAPRSSKNPLEVTKKQDSKELFQALQNLKESTKKRKAMPYQVRAQNERKLFPNNSNKKNTSKQNLNRSSSVNRSQHLENNQALRNNNLPLINSTASSFVYEDVTKRSRGQENRQIFQSPLLKSPKTQTDVHGIYNGRSSLTKNSKSTSALDMSQGTSSLGESSLKREGRNALQRKLEEAQKKLSEKEILKTPGYLLERKVQNETFSRKLKTNNQILIQGDQTSERNNSESKQAYNGRLGNSEKLSLQKGYEGCQKEAQRKNVIAQTVDTLNDSSPNYEIIQSAEALAEDVECIEQIHSLFVTFFQRKRSILKKVESKEEQWKRGGRMKGKTEVVGNLAEQVIPEKELE